MREGKSWGDREQVIIILIRNWDFKLLAKEVIGDILSMGGIDLI